MRESRISDAWPKGFRQFSGLAPMRESHISYAWVTHSWPTCSVFRRLWGAAWIDLLSLLTVLFLLVLDILGHFWKKKKDHHQSTLKSFFLVLVIKLLLLLLLWNQWSWLFYHLLNRRKKKPEKKLRKNKLNVKNNQRLATAIKRRGQIINK